MKDTAIKESNQHFFVQEKNHNFYNYTWKKTKPHQLKSIPGAIKIQSASKAVFDPTNKTTDLNLFTGLNYIGNDNGYDLNPLFKYLREHICSGDEKKYEYLLNWLSLSVQKPEVNPHVAIYLNYRTTNIYEKFFFSQMLFQLFGIFSINKTSLNTRDLENKLSLFLHTDFSSKSKSEYHKLVNLIKDDFIGTKNPTDNFLKTVIVNENDSFLDLIKINEKDNCFMVLNPISAAANLITFEEDNLNNAFMYYLLNRDITKFKVDQIPV